jgi:hypothetical protein
VEERAGERRPYQIGIKTPSPPALSPLRKEREKIPHLPVTWLNSMAVR